MAFSAAMMHTSQVVTDEQRKTVFMGGMQGWSSGLSDEEDDGTSTEDVGSSAETSPSVSRTLGRSEDGSSRAMVPIGSSHQSASGTELGGARAGPCPLCWAEQPYIVGEDAAKTAMLEKVQDFQKVIFRFEQMLTGRQDRRTVYLGMLALRRLHVERYLDLHGATYQKWTLAMLQEHYHPEQSQSHTFDLVRSLDREIDKLNEDEVQVRQDGLYIPLPDGSGTVYNIRGGDFLLRISRLRISYLTQKQSELRKRATETLPDYRLMMELLAASANREQNAGRSSLSGGDPATSVIANMYAIGSV